MALVSFRSSAWFHACSKAKTLVTAPASAPSCAAAINAPEQTRSNTHPLILMREVFYRSIRSEEYTSELQSHLNLVCRLLLEKKNIQTVNPGLHLLLDSRRF